MNRLPTLPGIYCIVNLINGNNYIGSAYNIRGRYNEHFRNLRNGLHCNKHLLSAFGIYGESNFEMNVLLICENFELLRYEQFFLDSCKPEYNMCPTAGNMAGFIFSDESREKLSVSHKGKWPEERCVNMSFPKSEEHRKKISEALKCKKKSSEHVAKIANANRGRKVSEEQRIELINYRYTEKFKINHHLGLLGNKNALGYRHSEKSRKEMSIKLIGNQRNKDREFSEEWKKNLSAAQKRRWKLWRLAKQYTEVT